MFGYTLVKKLKANRWFCLLLALAFVLGQPFLSKADGPESDITGVNLTIAATIEANQDLGTLEVTTESDRYTVESFAFIGAGSSWKAGQVPQIKIVLRAAEDYRFANNITLSRVKISGQGSCSRIKTVDSGYGLEISVRLKPVRGDVGDVGDVFWETTPVGKAKWEAAQDANAYEVWLYYKNTVIKKVEKTTTTTYNFYEYMTKAGTYYFKVRTVPRNSNEATYMGLGDWKMSEELYIEKSETAPERDSSALPTGVGGGPVPGWNRDGAGWWYREADNSYALNSWKWIDNKWYYFNLAGYMESGWIKQGGKYYYLTTNGDMVTGWLEDNKIWYYLGADGVMQTGWLTLDNNQYYLEESGACYYGWRRINEKWYYFSQENGAMARDTMVGTYYVNSDGVWIE